MRESLRARLLVWHTIVVAAVVAVFGAAIAYESWRVRVAVIDRTLHVRAGLLLGGVVQVPGGRVDVTLGPGLRHDDAPEFYHALWGPDGAIVDQSDAAVPMTRPNGDGAWTRQGRREVLRTSPAGVQVLVGTSLEAVRNDISLLVVKLGAIGAGILALSAAAGWWLIGRALEPLDRINRTARQMTGGDLAARIRVDSVESDVGQFAQALNSAFDQLQGAIDRQRRFTADASHELRTPLTSLSTEVQWALSRPRTPDELRSSIEVAGRAAQRMQAVIEQLLALARGEAQPLRTATVSLEDLVREAAADVRPLAAAAGVTVSLALAPVEIDADSSQLREAIANVLSNAIRYNVEGGRVDVSLTSSNGSIELAVSDTGIGIPAGDMPSIFEPFFRGDPARSRDTGGAGLGLAVTRAVVLRHGGAISCESEVGKGTTVTMKWTKAGSD
jgi:two-component system, OmpR family, sensor kinase